MENPKFNLQPEREIAVKKLLSGKVMNDDEQSIIFNTAIKHVSDLVEKQSEDIYGYDLKSEEIKKHLQVVVLDRIVSLRPQGSVTGKFADLKNDVCNQLGIEPEDLSNERLHSFLCDNLGSYFDKEISPEVAKGMDYVRSVVEQIVPFKI